MFIGAGNQVINPCIGQCGLDEDDVCMGCFRTGEEIRDWVNKGDDERIEIVIRCKKQMADQSQSNW